MKKNKKDISEDDAIMTLTLREKEVFYMLLEGMKAKEIASRHLSVSGVQTISSNRYTVN